LQDIRGGIGTLIPGTAFKVSTRDVSVSGFGAAPVGKRVLQVPGVIGWTAVVNSGAIVLGPFKADDISIYHETNLPAAQWLPKIKNFTRADMQFAATVMRPRRIAAQVS
jgi:hypothetical protein